MYNEGDVPIVDTAFVNVTIDCEMNAFMFGGLTTNMYVLNCNITGPNIYWRWNGNGQPDFQAVDVVLDGCTFDQIGGTADLSGPGVTIR